MSFAMMCQHPELEHKLRQEIFNVVGSSGRPTHDQMRDLKYVRAFLNEVLRLYPSVYVISLLSVLFPHHYFRPFDIRLGFQRDRPVFQTDIMQMCGQ